MKGSKTRLLVSVAVVAVALIIAYFLVQDIYRLQKRIEKLYDDSHWNYPMSQYERERISQYVDGIQDIITLRKTALVVVVAGASVTLLFLNKPELLKRIKEKYATVALIFWFRVVH